MSLGRAASALIATDLDRTMIFSRNAMGEEQFATVAPQCVEIYQDAPLSYLTPRAADLLAALSARVPVVPVTTRTAAQYGRITLPGSPFGYAVVSSGGRILVDGVDDRVWRTQVEARVAASSVELAEVSAHLEAIATADWVYSWRVADDLFCYLVVDLARQPADFLAQLQGWCAERGWLVSAQGRKIYTLPTSVTKSAALHHVRERLVEARQLDAAAPVFAAGDGRLDIDLLTYADHAIRPRHGELEALRWNTPGLTVTATSGALAGEEILAWFDDRTRDDRDPAEVGDVGAVGYDRISQDERIGT